ncbi:cation-transporting ATPase [Microbacterium oryzae]|uniref:cation-transporting ATPase n=1 Tax=Microbacterium oryzae TaxID=743009 RepID=UPI0025B08EE2|nr:cation-transporting ATPase [Microbacterium oryzae]MDN3312025.1 cation-transporting ATPase [Microbacterium oryzae]
MSKLNQIIKLAKKAMDAQSSSSSQRGSSSQNDWMAKARSAAESLLGDQSRPQERSDGYRSAATGVPRPPAPYGDYRQGNRPTPPAPSGSAQDRAAIARYDYLLQTARPDQIEQVHREAFARLTADQRAQVAARMRAELPPHEQPRSSDAPELARAAARTEATQPGKLRGLLARAGGVGVAGGVLAGAAGLLGVVAGGAILTSVGGALLEQAQGIDFDGIAENLDVQSIAEGAGGFVTEAGDYAQGFGDQVSEAGGGLGDIAQGFDIPGLNDFFGR